MYKKEERDRFLAILRAKNYNISKACASFGITRMTYYEWLNDTEFAEAIAEMKEEDIDDAEDTLRLLRKGVPKRDAEGNVIGWIIRPELTATIFYLKTQGKARGYVESQELNVTGKSDGPSWWEGDDE